VGNECEWAGEWKKEGMEEKGTNKMEGKNNSEAAAAVSASTDHILLLLSTAAVVAVPAATLVL
jgi:hypothetical protein